MQISDFTEGLAYEAKKTDFVPPDGSAVMPGETIRFTVLAPADKSNSTVRNGAEDVAPSATELESWKGFLRVQNHRSSRVHLLHPETIVSAQPITH